MEIYTHTFKDISKSEKRKLPSYTFKLDKNINVVDISKNTLLYCNFKFCRLAKTSIS